MSRPAPHPRRARTFSLLCLSVLGESAPLELSLCPVFTANQTGRWRWGPKTPSHVDPWLGQGSALSRWSPADRQAGPRGRGEPLLQPRPGSSVQPPAPCYPRSFICHLFLRLAMLRSVHPFFCSPIYSPVHPPTYSSLRLSTHPPAHSAPIDPSAHLLARFLYAPNHLPTHLSVPLPIIRPSIRPSTHPSPSIVQPSVHPPSSVCLFLHPSIHPSTCDGDVLPDPCMSADAFSAKYLRLLNPVLVPR